MKTDPELSPVASPERSPEELQTQLDAIIDIATRLKTASKSDENVQQILIGARGMLEAIGHESAKPHDEKNVPATKSETDVLHIEDDSLSFAAVKLLLGTKRKLSVLRADNGEKGIALAQTHAPRLILLDLDLPDIHGSEVLSRLQKDPATARTPVVVVSGDATPSQIERLLVLGARNYLTKPFEVGPFLAVVDEVLAEEGGVAAQT
jgi:CheY-like chemotaxis protein